MVHHLGLTMPELEEEDALFQNTIIDEYKRLTLIESTIDKATAGMEVRNIWGFGYFFKAGPLF